MPKDPLLSEDFFSLHLSYDHEIRFVLEELAQLEQSIKQKLYPHLSPDQKPTYYQGASTLRDLNRFIYQNEENNLYSGRFESLKNELKLSIAYIQLWATDNQIEETETLPVFLRKLEHASDNIALLYGDGKLLLEKLAILIDEPLIKLEARKNIIVNLLADKGLEKCVAGCYSRIASAALQLQENLDGKLQIEQWLRSYSSLMASNLAAKRPFAIPDTYQVMLCKASDSAIGQNLLHANNYLLMQAKEYGFPIEIQSDQGAIELGNGLTQSSKKAIIDSYIKDLEQHITAKNLIHYISEKLHDSFTQTLLGDGDYVDKTALILNKLNLLGEDDWFKTNKVGLEEILTDSGQLKTVDALQITVTQRLLARKLLKGFEAKKIILDRSNSLEYYEFSSEIALTWIWTDHQRIPLLKIINENRLSELIPLPGLAENARPAKMVPIIHNFIKDANSLLSVIKNFPISYDEFFDSVSSLRFMVTLCKKSESVKHFIGLLTHLRDKEKRLLFLKECGDEWVKKMLYQGLAAADIKTVLPGLAIDYLAEDYPLPSRQEALSVSKGLIKQLINSEYKQFRHVNFIKLPHPYLEEIDFSNSDFQGSKFFQTVRHCQFDQSTLDNVIFFEALEHISFKTTDLRKASFKNSINSHYTELNLEKARLSTKTFKELKLAYVINFIGANLREVNFQDTAVRTHLQYLDFTRANLESCDLSGLQLTGSIFWETNLAKTNLVDTGLRQIAINPQTNLEGSHLDLYTVHYLYRRGIKNFSSCNIYPEKSYEDNFIVYVFHQINFKKAQFIGDKLYIDFVSSDLSEALFTSNSLPHYSSSMTLSMRVSECNLDVTTFRHVKLISDSRFISSTFTQINFDNVEIPASLLFALYERGQRDFLGVKALQGPIPQKLMVFPVLDAKLNKESFLHLYRQGLRDFRGSSLNSFYLSQVLTEQAILAIDLKLEGAEYKQSPLGCASGIRHKRNILSSSLCAVHYLFQKTNTEKSISLTDIEVVAIASGKRFSLKESVLGPKPLYVLSDEVNEVNFHFGYRPDEEVFIKLDSFTKTSITVFEVSERKNVNLRFHLPKKFSDEAPLTEFARNMGQLGFDVKLNYYNQQMQLSRVEFKNRMLSITTLTATQEHILHTNKFRALLKNVKLNTLTLYNKEEYGVRLRQVTADVRRKIGSGTRTSGLRNGGQYEIGAAIIYFVGAAINNPGSAEIQVLAAENRTALKQLASHLAEEVGQERGANERQINATIRVAEQCIDRGECSTEKLVMRDVADSMQRLRPDLTLGNEAAWNSTKEFFEKVGSYLVSKFDEIKIFFTTIPEQVLPAHSRYWGPPSGILSLPSNSIQKKNIYNWYESPLLLRLIKSMESVFNGFGIDLQQDENFSEEKVAEILSKLWQILANCGVSNNVTEAFTLSVLKKLENTRFLENIFNSSQEFCATEFETTVIELSTVTYSSRQVSRGRRRQARDISIIDKLDFIKQETEADDAILGLADDYLVQYESRKKHPKENNHRQKNISVSSLNRQQRLSENNNKHIVEYEKKYKQKIKLDPKPNLSNKYSNKNYQQYKPAFLLPFKSPKQKQPLLDIKMQTPTFKNNQLSHLGIEGKHSKKQLKQSNGNYPLLQNAPSFFKKTHSGISAVTAHSDIQTSLFALDFCIKYLSKKKSSYTSVTKTPKLATINKMEERIIETKRNFYILSSNKK